MLRPLFTADSDEAAHELVGDALGRLRKPLPKVAAVLVLGRAGPARLLQLPQRPPAEAALDQPARAHQPRDRTRTDVAASSPTTAR
jgi:hypothetical protein